MEDKEQILTEHLGDSERKRNMSLVFIWGSRVLIEDGGLVYVSFQAFRNWLNKDKCSDVIYKSLMPQSQGFWYQDVWSQ